MDAKVTLSFDSSVIEKAKIFAEQNSISLSRLIEHLLRKATTNEYQLLDQMPVSDWVHALAEGQAEYKTKAKSKSATRADFYESKKMG